MDEGEGTNKRKKDGEENEEEEKRKKRQKTKNVTFVEPEAKPRRGTNTQIYSEDDVQRIRKLRKDKAAEKPTTDYLDSKDDRSDSSYTPDQSEPAMEPFSMESDLKYGRFDDEGTFIFKRRPRREGDGSDSDDSVKDPWFDSLREGQKKSSMEKQEAVMPNRDSSPSSSDDESLPKLNSEQMMLELCSYLESGDETPVQALKRLKERAAVVDNTTSRVTSQQAAPKKEEDDDGIDREASRLRAKLQRGQRQMVKKRMSDADQKVFDRVTELADLLMLGDSPHNVLSMTRNSILKLANTQSVAEKTADEEMLWQFRWRNSTDQTVYGPYRSSDLYSWVQAGYIKDATPVDLREVTPDGEPIEGIWHDWKLVRLEGKQFKTIEEEGREEKREDKEEKKSRKEEEEDSSDEEV